MPAEGLQEGLVIGHRGKGLLVEDKNNAVLLCHTRRRLGLVAVGDKVLWKAEAGDTAVVEQVLPRFSSLARPGARDKHRLFAANIDAMYIVSAPEPDPDYLLIDQCIVMCEQNHITPNLILNKVDIASKQQIDCLNQSFQTYENIGYQVFKTSAVIGQGIKSLETALNHHINIFTGQSGVGKSSLTSVLLPQRKIRIGELSETSGHGKHTTTAATLYHLPTGGDLIDSPGLAVFGLAGISQQQLAWGYREFREYIKLCRFNDCKHHQDKGCAVAIAVESGKICTLRYQRYLKLSKRIYSD
ncbi:MAG TPA: ribosome small subunit-dependent GTPase A [Crenotrichaceae bacterium]|nr:ribosome small subunit-dependent GTPase A [Crenotrichaceae bacterium]